MNMKKFLRKPVISNEWLDKAKSVWNYALESDLNALFCNVIVGYWIDWGELLSVIVVI